MSYTTIPLEYLIQRLIEKGLESFEALERGDEELQDELAEETYELGNAIVAYGKDGANALRPLLDDPREGVQLLGAAWLVKLDPASAVLVLQRLKCDTGGATAANAGLALMQARDQGLLS